MKKIISFLIAIVLTINIFPVIFINASAEHSSLPSNAALIAATEEIESNEFLSALDTETHIGLHPILNSHHWAANAFKYFYDKNFSVKTNEGTITCNRNKDVTKYFNHALTRREFVELVWNFAGCPKGYEANCVFTDVETSDKAMIGWAAKYKIVSGTGSNKFTPNGDVTREQTACIFQRLHNYFGEDFILPATASTTNFIDEKAISSWAGNAMMWAIENHLLSGCLNNGIYTLEPQGKITFAMMAVIIRSYIQNISKAKINIINAAEQYLQSIKPYTYNAYHEKPNDLSSYRKYKLKLAPETTWYNTEYNRRIGQCAYKAVMYLLWGSLDCYSTYAEIINGDFYIYLKFEPSGICENSDGYETKYLFDPSVIQDPQQKAYAATLLKCFDDAITGKRTHSRQINGIFNFSVGSNELFVSRIGQLAFENTSEAFFDARRTTAVPDCPHLYLLSFSSYYAKEMWNQRLEIEDLLNKEAAKIKNSADPTIQLKLITEYICQNYKYNSDYHWNQDLYTMLKSKEGCCYSFSLLFQAFAAKKGIHVDYCEGKAYTSGKGHSWNRYWDGTSYRYYDMTFSITDAANIAHTPTFILPSLLITN